MADFLVMDRLNRALGSRSGPRGLVVTLLGYATALTLARLLSYMTGVAGWLAILIVLAVMFCVWAAVTWAFLIRPRQQTR